MSDVTGTPFHNWCEICETNPGVHAESVHETPIVRVAGIYDQVRGKNPTVAVQVNYIDGDREPQIYVGASEVDLTLDGLDELIAVLQEMRQIARAVQPTPALAGMVTA